MAAYNTDDYIDEVGIKIAYVYQFNTYIGMFELCECFIVVTIIIITHILLNKLFQLQASYYTDQGWHVDWSISAVS